MPHRLANRQLAVALFGVSTCARVRPVVPKDQRLGEIRVFSFLAPLPCCYARLAKSMNGANRQRLFDAAEVGSSALDARVVATTVIGLAAGLARPVPGHAVLNWTLVGIPDASEVQLASLM